MTAQLDWIEQRAPAYAPQDLAAIDKLMVGINDQSVRGRVA